MNNRSSTGASNVVGSVFAGCFVGVFAIAFGGGGFFILSQGMQRHDWKAVFFSLPFLLVGIVAAGALVGGGRAIGRQNKLKAAHPNEPWMWNTDWASGQIPDHAVRGSVAHWIIALFWNGVAIPAAVGATQQYLRTHDAKALIALLFPAVGIGLIVIAIRATARAAYFGKSVLELQTLPASPGGALAGTIRIGQVLQPTGPIRLHLLCTRISRQGKNTMQTTVWEDEEELESVLPSNSGTDIPVYFAIPADVPTTSRAGLQEIAWCLEVRAATAEVNYSSKFGIPVFEASNPVVPAAPQSFEKLRHHETTPQPADMRGITLSRLADGGCVVEFAAARNRVAAAFQTVLGAILTGVLVVLIRSGAPLMPVMIVSLFAIIFDIGAVYGWLGSATITSRPTLLHIERGLPLIRRQRDIPASGISDIITKVSSTAGNTTYYAIMARVGAEDVKIVGGVRGKHIADYLAGEMKRSLGIPAAVQTTSRGLA